MKKSLGSGIQAFDLMRKGSWKTRARSSRPDEEPMWKICTFSVVDQSWPIDRDLDVEQISQISPAGHRSRLSNAVWEEFAWRAYCRVSYSFFLLLIVPPRACISWPYPQTWVSSLSVFEDVDIRDAARAC